jgi:aspartyl/asparaginyl beta-hydroxylase (cupin superfamily)
MAAENELEKAFSTLAEALNLTESEIGEEIKVIQQQIQDLKERIVQLNGQQQTLAHDKESISEMFNRYCATETGAPKVEF